MLLDLIRPNKVFHIYTDSFIENSQSYEYLAECANKLKGSEIRNVRNRYGIGEVGMGAVGVSIRE